MNMTWLVLPLRVTSESWGLQQQGSGAMSVVHVTTKGQRPCGHLWSGLLPGAMLMSEGCAGLVLTFTQNSRPPPHLRSIVKLVLVGAGGVGSGGGR